MNTQKRRQKIIDTLKESSKTVSGTELASLLGVSRQIIVQDIAIIRAKGEPILATPNGYVISSNSPKVVGVFACKHMPKDLEEELYTIVDNGGKVLDVSIDHPLYGEIKANLMLANRRDVDNFIKEFKELEAAPLSALTEGVHLHNIEAENKLTLEIIEEELRKKNFLLD